MYCNYGFQPLPPIPVLGPMFSNLPQLPSQCTTCSGPSGGHWSCSTYWRGVNSVTL